jgi:hypothetical protein
MIEVYSFLAVFTIQILVMSVLQPVRFIGAVRAEAKNFPADRFAQRYPGVDHNEVLNRYLVRYHVANTGIAVLGAILLGWLFNYMQRPDWNDGLVGSLVTLYFFMQASPVLIGGLLELRYRKLLEHLLEGKRTAVLERRGLFDFVSPIAVVLAVLCYCLFVACVLYAARHPFPGFGGVPANVGIVTAGHAFLAFIVYRTLYGKKVNTQETHAARTRGIEMVVKACVYMSIVSTVAASLGLVVKLLEVQSWGPFRMSAYYLIFALFALSGMSAQRRKAAD